MTGGLGDVFDMSRNVLGCSFTQNNQFVTHLCSEGETYWDAQRNQVAKDSHLLVQGGERLKRLGSGSLAADHVAPPLEQAILVVLPPCRRSVS